MPTERRESRRLPEILRVPASATADELSALIEAAKSERADNQRIVSSAQHLFPRRNNALGAFIHECRLRLDSLAKK